MLLQATNLTSASRQQSTLQQTQGSTKLNLPKGSTVPFTHQVDAVYIVTVTLAHKEGIEILMSQVKVFSSPLLSA